MEPESSLPCSQKPVTGPYREPGKSSPHPHTLLFLEQFLISSFNLHVRLQNGPFLSDFLTYLFAIFPMRATFPAHLILRDLIKLIISDVE
jgi:hypothetical protein